MADINVAGVWKAADPSINVAGVWKTPEEWINVAGTWKKTYPVDPEVDLSGITSLFHSTAGGTCYAGWDIRSNGSAYKVNANGTFSLVTPPWLSAGENSDVWVARTINSGTLSTDEIGSGRAALTSDRMVRIQTTGFKTTTITLNFYDAASGGNLLASKQIVLEADATLN